MYKVKKGRLIAINILAVISILILFIFNKQTVSAISYLQKALKNSGGGVVRF